MKKFHVGLDFGTYHSKICVQYVEEKVHEFFIFPQTNSPFLLSRVAEKENGTFEYGESLSGAAVREYFYFKMAAAEDEEFWTETSIDSNSIHKAVYDPVVYAPHTPEFLTSIYITYVLLTVREHYQKKSPASKSTGSFLGRLLRPDNEKEEINMTIRMGIPTEWSQRKNLRRKRKFENILSIADELMNEYKNVTAFLSANASELKTKVSQYYKSHQWKTVEEFNTHINEKGLSVYPETAAGLTFITKTRQLIPGYYAIMDIGGGTTDISFFRLINNDNIKYIASESYMVAANNVYKEMLYQECSTKDIHNMGDLIMNETENNTWQQNYSLLRSAALIRNQLEEFVYKLFFKRVHWFHHSGLSKKFNKQPIIAYGGGFEVPEILSRNILINDHGVRTALVNPYYMEVSEIHKYKSKIKILPDEKLWKKYISMLVVALGLSFIKPLGSADWFDDDDYHPMDGDSPQKPKPPFDRGTSSMQQHPFNEDYYIYNVLLSKWG